MCIRDRFCCCLAVSVIVVVFTAFGLTIVCAGCVKSGFAEFPTRDTGSAAKVIFATNKNITNIPRIIFFITQNS